MRLANLSKNPDNGEITNLKPYIETENWIFYSKLQTVVWTTIYWNEVNSEVISHTIQNGHASEYYDFWKHHSDKYVEMAKKGLFRDEFIKDAWLRPLKWPEYLMKLANRTDSGKKRNR